jgi:hypothetical protein
MNNIKWITLSNRIWGVFILFVIASLIGMNLIKLW